MKNWNDGWNDSWNDGMCMGYKNAKSKKRCCRTVVNNTDFCRYHYKRGIYNRSVLNKIRNNDNKDHKINRRSIAYELKKICTESKVNNKFNILEEIIKKNTEELTNNFNFMLMNIKDCWEEVPIHHRIKISDGWWDITLLMQHIVSQLNRCEMENPFPIYPSSPFTRELYTTDDIIKIKNRILKLNIPINISLKIFLKASPDNIQLFFDDAKARSNRFSPRLVDYLKDRLRYRMINRRNSQSSFMGYWVKLDETETYFEQLYNEYKLMPLEVYMPLMGYVRNSRRDMTYKKMISLSENTWGPNNDHTLEYMD